MKIRKLHPLFGAEIVGVDITKPIDDTTFGEIRAAFEEYSLLLFRDLDDLTDERQVAFSERFGPLQKAFSANPGGGSPFSRQSNIDIRTGEVIPAQDRRMVYQLANRLWHTDGSYRAIPALCSLLSGREVPPEGGATEIASMRAGWEALPEDRQRLLEGLVAEHSIAHSRSLVDPNVLTQAQKDEMPPARQALVRTNSVNGRKALFIGAHASHIVGWPIEEGRKLLNELLELTTQPRFVYRHEWRRGDMLVWDNRCLLHRATPYDAERYRRVMQRTTVAGDGPTVPVPS